MGKIHFKATPPNLRLLQTRYTNFFFGSKLYIPTSNPTLNPLDVWTKSKLSASQLS